MNENINRFANVAQDWDKKPTRVKLALSIAKKIDEQISLKSSMQALDFGCGTGLISFPLASSVKNIHGLDLSAEMVDVFNNKAKEQGIANVSATCFEPDKNSLASENYDIIFSGMVFHHIERIDVLVKDLYSSLKPGGVICIADLDKEDSSFHSNNTGVHHFGFERKWVGKCLEEAGFSSIVFHEAYTIKKENKDYPVFLAIAMKA